MKGIQIGNINYEATWSSNGKQRKYALLQEYKDVSGYKQARKKKVEEKNLG